jgi:hypothetical protein
MNYRLQDPVITAIEPYPKPTLPLQAAGPRHRRHRAPAGSLDAPERHPPGGHAGERVLTLGREPSERACAWCFACGVALEPRGPAHARVEHVCCVAAGSWGATDSHDTRIGVPKNMCSACGACPDLREGHAWLRRSCATRRGSSTARTTTRCRAARRAWPPCSCTSARTRCSGAARRPSPEVRAHSGSPRLTVIESWAWSCSSHRATRIRTAGKWRMRAPPPCVQAPLLHPACHP